MTTKKMPEAIARLEGWTYSESYDIPSPEGSEDFSGGGTATVPKLVAVNRLSKAWWIDGGGRVGPTYVWNSDPQLDLELAAMGMEIDAEIGSDVVGNTRYYLLKGIC